MAAQEGAWGPGLAWAASTVEATMARCWEQIFCLAGDGDAPYSQLLLYGASTFLGLHGRKDTHALQTTPPVHPKPLQKEPRLTQQSKKPNPKTQDRSISPNTKVGCREDIIRRNPAVLAGVP